MTKIISWAVFLSLVLGCSKGQVTDQSLKGKDAEMFRIDLSSAEKDIDRYGNQVKNSFYVRLDFDSLNLISECSKILFHKEKFYILDRKLSALNVYDKAGHFMHTVGNLGGGPGEYSRLDDFDIDEKTNRVILFSNDNQSVYYFTDTGKFLERTKVEFFGGYFSSFVPNEYVFYSSYNIYNDAEPKNLVFTDTLGKVKFKYFSFPVKARSSISFSGQIYKNKDGILFSHSLSDTIYQIGWDHSLYTKYIVDLGPKTYSKTEDLFDHMKFMQIGLDYSVLGRYVVESNDHLFFDYVRDRRDRKGIFDLRTKKVFTEDSFKDNTDFSLHSTPVGCFHGDTLISVIYPARFFYIKEKNPDLMAKLRATDEALYAALKDLKPEDNPVLFLYTMK